MSKKVQKRASRRAQVASLLSQPDERRDWLMQQVARGRVQTTPKEWQQRDPAPWYLPELGLHREPFQSTPPRGELPPIIHTLRR